MQKYFEIAYLPLCRFSPLYRSNHRELSMCTPLLLDSFSTVVLDPWWYHDLMIDRKVRNTYLIVKFFEFLGLFLLVIISF